MSKNDFTIECLRMSKVKGEKRRESDKSTNEIWKITRVGMDLLVETKDYIYRFGLMKVLEILFKIFSDYKREFKAFVKKNKE